MPVTLEAPPLIADRRRAPAAVPPEPAPSLSLADAALIGRWAASLKTQGQAPSSVERAAKRVRAFARRVPPGLLHATQRDVARFAVSRAGADDRALLTLMRTDTWRKTVTALSDFYAWAAHSGLTSPGRSPLRGLKRLPRAPVGHIVRPGLIRRYETLLHHPRLTARDRALLWTLAHGLSPAEVVRLRVADVDLEAGFLRVASRSPRVVPLSVRAVTALDPWVRVRRRTGYDWLFGLQPGKPPAARLVSDVVARAGAIAFPAPSQRTIRHQLRASDFRNIFIQRALRQRIAVDCFIEITGIDRLSRLRRYVGQTVTRERLHRELRLLGRRWRRWI